MTDGLKTGYINLKHAQNTDTALGAMAANVNMNTHKLTGLSVPADAGDSIRATAKITEALLESATDLKHSNSLDHAQNHALIDTTGHTASGLTIGHFLKATGPTTYGFAAHGLTYSDVGADASGASATVQGNLNTHAGLTTTAHGLGASAFHADAFFALAGHNHTGVYDPAGTMTTHESTYNHTNYNTAYSHSQAVTGAEHGAVVANTANMIVRRGASGEFTCGVITGSLTGNVTGNVSGSSGSCSGNAATSSSCSGNAATSSSCSGNAASSSSCSGNTAGSSGSCTGNAATSSSCSGNAATSSSCTGNAATSSSCSGNAATSTNATNHIADVAGAVHGAVSANTVNMIVRRGASGEFSAGTITANITGNISGSSGSTTGNAATATALQTARNIFGVSFNGTADIGSALGTGAYATIANYATLASPTFTGTVTLPSGQALIAPALGTPASGNLVNCTGITVGDASVSQAKLKTAMGEVSAITLTHLTLPGGEYGFYPQLKTGLAGYLTARMAESGTNTSYATIIYVAGQGAARIYAQQRYVTSSGEVFWIFILRDKATKKPIASYAAPDHPCFGNGGDPVTMPHPFIDYNEETQEIVCITFIQEEIAVIKSRVPKRSSLLQHINETYVIDDETKPAWPTKEITVGLPDGYDWQMAKTGDTVEPIKMVIPKPGDILVRGLRRK